MNFCPYCMTKLAEETSVLPPSKKKSRLLPIAAAAAAVVLIGLAGLLGAFKKQVPASASSPGAASPASSASSEKDETGINVDGSIISWANMKIDNPNLKLSDGQLQVLKYFDNDYLSVNTYENLQRYPKIYRNAQIYFDGVVTKILQMDDENYECLFWMGGWLGDDGHLVESAVQKDKLLVLRGKQPANARVAVGDRLRCYGRYLDVQSFTVDGASAYYPTVSVNYTTAFSDEGASERFDLSTIQPVAKTILGNDIKIKEPVYGKDFTLDELHTPQYYFYLVTPDNQSNSNFSQFEFSRMEGFIRDAKSTVDMERLFHVAADFEHYIVSVYDRNLHLMYLEYYDRDYKKIWSREFENVDTVPYDYTTKEIALVADNDLYLIDTQTGKDLSKPVLVGEKVSVNIMSDGIVMIGTGNKDNVMKVDRLGSPLWKASVNLEVTECIGLQIIDGNVVAKLIHTESTPMPEKYGGGEQLTAYRSDIAAIDNTGAVLSQFTDVQYNAAHAGQ